jgi:DNA-binding transcriptional ArsR family regulator
VTNRRAALDHVFHALADPARRDAVARLASGPKSVTELFAPRSLSRPSMLQHVRVLETSGLVRSEKIGRVRLCHLNRPALGWVTDWLGAHVATMDEEEAPS